MNVCYVYKIIVIIILCNCTKYPQYDVDLIMNEKLIIIAMNVVVKTSVNSYMYFM